MDEKVTKYLLDIQLAIAEINQALDERSREFEIFLNDFVFRKFVERNIEIIGEAMNRILRINPDIGITSARKIVDTRNYVIHAYDSLIPEILWAIVINHLPRLEEEVKSLIAK
ncbi:MAG: DUF86 domain-containing protein [Muribaculaceae bacterium]|nr:DUF86 domain-containing protein [Muribaculaceae bacterium]